MRIPQPTPNSGPSRNLQYKEGQAQDTAPVAEAHIRVPKEVWSLEYVRKLQMYLRRSCEFTVLSQFLPPPPT